jgi:hypothetical protein
LNRTPFSAAGKKARDHFWSGQKLAEGTVIFAGLLAAAVTGTSGTEKLGISRA